MTVFFVICLAVCRTFIHSGTYIFSVTKMPLFGLQACVGNYQKITNTNAADNNPPVKKTKAATIYLRDAVSAVIATATWLAGWLGGWLSVTAGIISKRQNLS